MENHFVQAVVFFVFLLFFASVAAIFLKKIRFSYTIGLVILGIVLQRLSCHIPQLEPISKVTLTPNVILYILLPTLIFSAAFTIDSRMLMKNILPVLALSAPGLIISTLATGFIVAAFTPLGLGHAMLFGALISATDPVAVVALFAEIGAPKRLRILVDGESLFNDATAIVTFRIIFGMIASGAAWGMSSFITGSIDFCTVFFGGVLVGTIVGLVTIKITSWAKDDPLIQIALSTVAAYVAFILADHHLQLSGVMSAMAAGIVLSWFGLTKYTPEAKQYMTQFWEYAAFVGNSFIFLLLGITEASLLTDFKRFSGLFLYVAVAVAAVTVARAIVVFGLCPIIGKIRKSDTINMPYQTIIFWGGLRGAVPLALAFSLASDYPNRQLIIELTLGVVLFTLLVQGTSIAKLMNIFALNDPSVPDKIFKAQTILEAREGATAILKSPVISLHFKQEILDKYARICNDSLENSKKELNDLINTLGDNQNTLRRTIRTKALLQTRKFYKELYEHNFMSESVLRELELINSEAYDRVDQDQLPDINLFPVPLEHKISTFMTRFILKFFPNSRLSTKIRINDFKYFYETASAMLIAAYQLEDVFNTLEVQHPAQKIIIEEFRRAYHQRRAALIGKLNEKSAAFPDIFDSLREKTLSQILKKEEISIVRDRMGQGGISESLGSSIISRLSSENHQ